MIKKHLHPVSTGIIVALLISNGVVGYQFYKENDRLTAQIDNKTEQYQELEVNYTYANELLNEKEIEINANKDTITNLNNDNKKLNEAIVKHKEDIDSLKEQLTEARKRDKELP